jgi:hypothetical protein
VYALWSYRESLPKVEMIDSKAKFQFVALDAPGWGAKKNPQKI